MTMQAKAIKLGGNTYCDGDYATGGLRVPIMPDLDRFISQQECPGALYQPQKDFGPKALTISIEITLPDSMAPTFLVDVADGSIERKLTWLDTGIEVYTYVLSGIVTKREIAGEGKARVYQVISCVFTATRTAIYKASDDTIWLGGS